MSTRSFNINYFFNTKFFYNDSKFVSLFLLELAIILIRYLVQ